MKTHQTATPYSIGVQDAKRGYKPFPPAPWRFGTAEAYAAATRAYEYGYEHAVSGIKVAML